MDNMFRVFCNECCVFLALNGQEIVAVLMWELNHVLKTASHLGNVLENTSQNITTGFENILFHIIILSALKSHENIPKCMV